MKLAGRRAMNQVRKFALGFPEAHEDHPWGHDAFKVGRKVFLFSSMEKDQLSFSMKLNDSNEQALKRPYAESTGYGLGKSGWVTVRFGLSQSVPVEQILRWIEESYRLIAPKKLVKLLDAPGERAAAR